MTSKKIIQRVERLGGRVVAKAGKGSHKKMTCRSGTYKTIVPRSDNVHPEALSLWYDDAVSATIVDRVELEPGLKEELAETEELARIHSDVSRKLAARRRRTVRVLQKKGLGTRDIAELLDLSQPRVSQIARGTR